jgi:hypothetical protein
MRSWCRVRPDEFLVGAGGDLDRLGDIAVGGELPHLVPAGPAHVRQALRVEEVIFLPRVRDRLLVPGGLLRVRRVDPVPGRGQCLRPRTAIRLDDHDDLRRVRLAVPAEVRGDQFAEPRDPIRALGQPAAGQRLASLVLHGHIVVTLGPVIANEQRSRPLPRTSFNHRQRQGESPAP